MREEMRQQRSQMSKIKLPQCKVCSSTLPENELNNLSCLQVGGDGGGGGACLDSVQEPLSKNFKHLPTPAPRLTSEAAEFLFGGGGQYSNYNIYILSHIPDVMSFGVRKTWCWRR